MRRFEFRSETSNKFWEVALHGDAFTVHYGRLGTEGKTQTKSFSSAEKARAEAEKLILEKVGKGYVEVAFGAGATLAPVSAAAKPVLSGPMTEAVFWEIISLFNWKRTGDDDAVLRPAVNALAKLSVQDIYAFDDLLAEKLYALDTREVCRGVYRGELDPDNGEQYISADDFLYSRCVIVANGRAYFEGILADPREAPQGLEFEALLGLAAEAYEKKTGDEYDHDTPLSWESFSNKEGWRPGSATRAGTFNSETVPPGNRRPA